MRYRAFASVTLRPGAGVDQLPVRLLGVCREVLAQLAVPTILLWVRGVRAVRQSRQPGGRALASTRRSTPEIAADGRASRAFERPCHTWSLEAPSHSG